MYYFAKNISFIYIYIYIYIYICMYIYIYMYVYRFVQISINIRYKGNIGGTIQSTTIYHNIFDIMIRVTF